MRKLFGFVLLAALFSGVTPGYAQNINVIPTRQFGHVSDTLTSGAPNRLDARGIAAPAGIAVDLSGPAPVLWIADFGNNRVLGYRNPNLQGRAQAADFIIGQRDFFSNGTGGPGTGLVTGLNGPLAVAVDGSGNLYVADGGNNRILRFPNPVGQQNDLALPDLVIGQKQFGSGRAGNQGAAAPSAKTLFLSNGTTFYKMGMAVDAGGNLWVTDPNNHRALRFPAAQLASGTIEPEADLVLGQFNFTTRDRPAADQSVANGLFEPSAIAVSAQGAVYVADTYGRVLYFPAPATGGAASRILGRQRQDPANPLTYPSRYTLGNAQGNSLSGDSAPTCLFLTADALFVCDPSQNRVVRYTGPSGWGAATDEQPSPPQADVYGQPGLSTGQPNRGQTSPGANTLRTPSGVAFVNGSLWILDSGNNRLLFFGERPNYQYSSADGVLGQLDFNVNSFNLVEGQEVFVNAGDSRGSSVAVDAAGHMYIADRNNHRILGFRDVRSVDKDTIADLVIGQPNRFQAILNYPSGDTLIPSDQGLLIPAGVAVDAAGNLYVADSGNGRVLRFPSPFDQPAGTVHRANLVLGQLNFTQKIQDASATTMREPFGVVVFNNGALAVSDATHNRVLIFRKNGGDFTTGQPAAVVLGQPDFGSSGVSSGASGLRGPRGIAVDSSDRLYVADTANNRFVVYSNTGAIQNGASGFAVTGTSGPEGIAVSPTTGQIWLASRGNNQIRLYPEFFALQQSPTVVQSLQASAPIAVGLDRSGNVIGVDSTNRVNFYYRNMFSRHAARFSATRPLAPGTLVEIARRGENFEFQPIRASSIPYGTELGDIQVTVDGIPAPVYEVRAASVFFIVPWHAPTSGLAEFVVTRASTNEVLGAANFPMDLAAPGLFTSNQAGTGQVAASNGDNSVNSPSNPVDRRGRITFWLTGLGRVSNPPPDGAAPGAAVTTPVKPVVIINGAVINEANITYAGLSPQYPGLYQINVQLTEDMALPPDSAISVIVVMNDIQSNILGTANPDSDILLQGAAITSFATK